MYLKGAGAYEVKVTGRRRGPQSWGNRSNSYRERRKMTNCVRADKQPRQNRRSPKIVSPPWGSGYRFKRFWGPPLSRLPPVSFTGPTWGILPETHWRALETVTTSRQGGEQSQEQAVIPTFLINLSSLDHCSGWAEIAAKQHTWVAGFLDCSTYLISKMGGIYPPQSQILSKNKISVL